MQKSSFLDRFSKEIDEGNAAVFAGAGLSVAAGFVNWKALLSEIAHDLGLDVERESDLTGLAQFHVNRHGGNRGHLNQLILEEFPTDVDPTVSQRLIAKLPISTIWTTNYDHLLERAVEREHKVADVKFQVAQLAHTKPKRDCTIYKMHGDVDHPQTAVLTRDDYETYERDRGAFLNALAGDLTSKTFLFLGFSFTDPNLEKVLAHIRIRFKENQRPHYAIFKKVAPSDFNGETKDEDYEYAKTRQTLVLDDLRRFNINAILVEEHEEVTSLLEELYRRHRARYVFVSTAAADFSPWGEEAVIGFMGRLGRLMAARNFRLVTGVGLGTGNAILGGALYSIASDGSKKMDHEIVVRPFPQHYPNAEEREAHWLEYRRDMISRAGISLFLFGNKSTAAGVVPSLGMKTEFDIAVEEGLVTIPVAATNSISRSLHEELTEKGLDDDEGFPREEFLKLPNEVDELDQLLGPILEILEASRDSLV